MPKTETKIIPTLTPINPAHESQLESVAAQLSMLTETIANLRLGRGTRDLAPMVANDARLDDVQQVAPVAPAPLPTLAERIEARLRAESQDLASVARFVRTPEPTVAKVLAELSKAGKTHNVGTVDHPVWCWKIGDDTTTIELTRAIRQLISERPMSTRELAVATGARLTRVGGAVVAIQRSGDKILNLGRGHTARWFLLERAKDARLSPKAAAK